MFFAKPFKKIAKIRKNFERFLFSYGDKAHLHINARTKQQGFKLLQKYFCYLVLVQLGWIWKQPTVTGRQIPLLLLCIWRMRHKVKEMSWGTKGKRTTINLRNLYKVTWKITTIAYFTFEPWPHGLKCAQVNGWFRYLNYIIIIRFNRKG